jgi:hypothetical protein
MALELEHRHGGKLGLVIVPVGLTYSAKERYRSDVLGHFGESIRAADFLEGYPERKKECITRLTGEIERRIQSLILHIPELEHTRVVEGVKRLYRERVAPGSVDPAAAARGAEDLVLVQRIAAAVGHIYATEPERAAAFASRLHLYERRLERLRLSDESLALVPRKGVVVVQNVFWSLVAVVGAPVALYGWAHRLIPWLLIRQAAVRLAEPGKRKAQASTAAIVVGVLVFGLFYGACVLGVHWLFGFPVSLWYALSLPVGSLLAHYYWREVRRLAAGLRNLAILLRAPWITRRLLALRNELIREIEAAASESRKRRVTAAGDQLHTQ